MELLNNIIMEKEVDSYKLTKFNLDGQIMIGSILGLIKILRSDDNNLILVCDYSYDLIDNTKPSQQNIINPDSALGFVLDIGIERERRLTYGSGFYFGTKLKDIQSRKKISQKDFNKKLLQKIDLKVNGYYKSGDNKKELEAIKLSHILNSYNTSRLLFPQFYNDSYLGLMRIIEAILPSSGACDFALSVASSSKTLNSSIYKKINKSYPKRIKIATTLFNDIKKLARSRRWSCYSAMLTLDKASKIVFSCFYSAYQYRNKFVHQGIPFPFTVKESLGLEVDSGTAYLNPAEGISLTKIIRPNGLQARDSIDIHDIISDKKEIIRFQEKYFILLPTWHYMKIVVRNLLIGKVNNL